MISFEYTTNCVKCGSEIDIEESIFKVCPYCGKLQKFREKEEGIAKQEVTPSGVLMILQPIKCEMGVCC